MNKLSIITVLSFFLFTIGCIEDDFDKPDNTGCYDEGLEATITIADLKDGFNGTIAEDHIIEGIVVGDDKTGNFYKQMVIQDETGGIAIQVDRNEFYVNYPAGRTVYVKLKDLYIGVSNGSHQIGASNDGGFVARLPQSLIDEHIKKGPCNDTLNIPTISLNDLGDNDLVNTLVRIENVEFADGLDGITFADAQNSSSKNIDLEDCNGNSAIVRTSGFSELAAEIVPGGNGTIYVVYQKYNNDNQLLIRDMKDVAEMVNDRCDGSSGATGVTLLSQDFESGNVTSDGWSLFSNSAFGWVANDQFAEQGSWYAQCSNFNAGSNTATEAWLVSPAVDLTGQSNPKLTFINAANYDGDDMEVYVSTDYDGSSDPNTATWDQLTVSLSSGGWDWVTSTNDLSAYGTSNSVYIGFKYIGTNSDGSTWEIDAIKVSADE